MKPYHDLGNLLLSAGKLKLDRTGKGRWSLPQGQQMRYNLLDGYPLLGSKFVPFRPVAEELIWFISGSSNNNDLVAKNVNIWTPWARADGELGPVYGSQWRKWHGVRELSTGDVQIITIDQIEALEEGLRTNPFSSRHILTAWNPALMPDEKASHIDNINAGLQVLPACHTMFQVLVERLDGYKLRNEVGRALQLQTDKTVGMREIDNWMRGNMANQMSVLSNPDRREYLKNIFAAQEADDAALRSIGGRPYKLDLQLYQRSADFAIGVPFNIASYALLQLMLAQVTDMVPGEFVHTFGDVHLYDSHRDNFKMQMQRPIRAMPKLYLNKNVKKLTDFRFEDFRLVDYVYDPKIEYEVAV